MSNTANTIIGTGPLDLLTIAFVILKLCKVIDWSWWWVFSPLWIPLAIIVVIGILVALFSFD
jgi:hypothetical protein